MKGNNKVIVHYGLTVIKYDFNCTNVLNMRALSTANRPFGDAMFIE